MMSENKGNEFIIFFLIAWLTSCMQNPWPEGTILQAKGDTKNK